MKEPVLHLLFAKPVFKSRLQRNLSKTELKFLEKSLQNLRGNVGNKSSNDGYILNRKPLKKLKNDIEKFGEYYFRDVQFITKKTKPLLTQSWLNVSKENEFHHSHFHPNSYVSGVFYLNADANNDTITFIDDTYNQIQPEVYKYETWNSEEQTFNVETNDIILFPSSLRHKVNQKKGNNDRISLAFNFFVTGTIGHPFKFTELKI